MRVTFANEGVMMYWAHRLFASTCLFLFASSALAATDLSSSITGSTTSSAGSLVYRLFEPEIQPGEKKPLILYLHGMGERGTDNLLQTTWISNLVSNTRTGQYGAYVLAPQIDENNWFQSFSTTATPAMSLTLQTLHDVMASKEVDLTRVYVTGVSMGAMGAWDALAREPETFAAAVTLSGGMDTKTAATIKDKPIWAFHGGADDIVPVSATRDSIDALRAAGGLPRYTEIAGGGHVVWDPIYDDPANILYPWLFSQVLGQAPTGTGLIRVTVPPDGVGAFTPVGVSGEEVLAFQPAVPEPAVGFCVFGVAIAMLRRR